jgi:hypothetical protein
MVEAECATAEHRRNDPIDGKRRNRLDKTNHIGYAP